MAGVVRAPCHPQHPQCSFPFHLECEIAAGAALTSALRGQLLKSDVRLSGWETSTDGGKEREGKKWKEEKKKMNLNKLSVLAPYIVLKSYFARIKCKNLLAGWEIVFDFWIKIHFLGLFQFWRILWKEINILRINLRVDDVEISVFMWR